MYRILDAERLYIEVRPSGTKIWRIKYTFNGKEGTLSLGEYPSVSLLEARRKKDEIKAMLASGINPSENRKEEKIKKTNENKNTFKAIADEYFEDKLKNRSTNYQDAYLRAMEKDIFPIIGKKAINKVTSADVLEIMEKTLSRVRSQKNHGTGEVTAIQNRQFVGKVMRYAIATLRAEYDPTYAVREVIERPEVNHARPLETDELKRLRSRLETYKGSQTVKNAGLLMLYTMLRTIEIRKMEWSFIDFDKQVITFPKTMMKKKRIHIVPMSEQVHRILLEQKKISENLNFVFPSVYKSGMLSAATLNRMLEYIQMNDVTAHDFRATASTLLNEMDYDEKWIEKQLAHAEKNKTKASYDHSKHLTQRRKMLQDWADMVDSWSK